MTRAQVMMRRGALLATLFGGFLLLATPLLSHAAFGISPPFIHAVHLVPGAKYSQTIYLVQDRPDQDLPIAAQLDIADSVRPWISIDPGFDFVIPHGVRQFPVTIVIQVPKDAPLSAYVGHVSFASKPAQEGQVTIALGAEVSLNIAVGDDVYRSIKVARVDFPDIEEGWAPRAYVKFENNGNVAESFDAATFEVYDQFDAARLSYASKNGGFPETPPFSVKEYTVEFPIDLRLSVGEYWGSVNFYQNGQVVASQKTVFNVLKAGSLSSPFDKVLLMIRDNLVASIAVVVIVILIGYIMMTRRRRT